ncbi:MAG: hypothetical protein RLZ55_1788, partial [Actinomycetota bacterium]
IAGHVQRGQDGAVTGYGLASLPGWVRMPVAEPGYSVG